MKISKSAFLLILLFIFGRSSAQVEHDTTSLLLHQLYLQGTNPRYNNATLDGAINADAFGYNPILWGVASPSGIGGSIPLPLNALKDKSIGIAPFSVTQGNFTSVNVNEVTRSGTNTFTGSIYGYGRNAAITGPDKIGGQGKMPGDFYNYTTGISMGFPIIRNKLFFFSNEELGRETIPVQQVAGSPISNDILSSADAQNIRQTTIARYHWDPGTYGQYNATGSTNKYFNRLDWNINARNQLTIHNDIVSSKAVNFGRDQQFFQFGSFAYTQSNTFNSTIAELKSKFNERLSNDLMGGYTWLHAARDPTSDPALPQIQIRGNTPGTAIFIGTGRDASINDQKENVFEVTDNLGFNAGRHSFLFGTHNEFHNVKSNFINSWNGRLDYLSVDDYLNALPYQVRGSYNYVNDSRSYILAHPAANFNVDYLSAYAEDKIDLPGRVRLTAGLRLDYTEMPEKPRLTARITGAYTDPYFNNNYAYTPLDQINNSFFNRPQLSPRIGFDWAADKAGRLKLHAGAGLFSGRLPLAWLSNAFTNDGNKYGSFDQKYAQTPYTPGTDPALPGSNGIGNFIAANGVAVNNKAAGRSEIDVIDNNFKLPKVAKLDIRLDYSTASKFDFTLEAIYSKTIHDFLIRDINYTDNPGYFGNDSTARRQPIYSTQVDPLFTNVYELSNTSEGYSYRLTALIRHTFRCGVGFVASYSYGVNKNVEDYPGNSMENAWQLAQSINPNDPKLAYSNYDIRHRIRAALSYDKSWNAQWVSKFSFELHSQSGVPFTYGYLVNGIQGTEQTVSLAYIPTRSEAVSFFQDLRDAGDNVVASAAQQAGQFNAYIDNNKYLSGRRGGYTERNGARTPWSTQLDLHFEQTCRLSKKDNKNYISLSIDLFNLNHLLDKRWGVVYFAPGTYNGTASIGLVPGLVPSKQNPGNYPVYTFRQPASPYSVDYLNSRVRGQLGVRYSF